MALIRKNRSPEDQPALHAIPAGVTRSAARDADAGHAGNGRQPVHEIALGIDVVDEVNFMSGLPFFQAVKQRSAAQGTTAHTKHGHVVRNLAQFSRSIFGTRPQLRTLR